MTLLIIAITTMLKCLFFCMFHCVKNVDVPVLFWLFQNHVNDQQQQQHETTVQKRVKKSTFDALFLKAKLMNGLSPPHQCPSLFNKEGHWCGGYDVGRLNNREHHSLSVMM